MPLPTLAPGACPVAATTDKAVRVIMQSWMTQLFRLTDQVTQGSDELKPPTSGPP